MNWLSREEIKRRAKISDEEALNVSIEEWEGKRDAVKRVKRDEWVRCGREYCGLCQRHNPHCDGDGCRYCIIYNDDDNIDCCQEYQNFCSKETLLNAQAMLNRLYLERGKRYPAGEAQPKKECKKEKPELRHGDYGHYKDSGELWWAWQRKEVLELFGSYQGCGDKIILTSDMTKDGNHIDDLERNSKDLEEFEVESDYGGKLRIRINNNNEMGFTLPYCDSATLGIARATEAAHAILQEVATAKRKAKKDC